MNVICSIPIVRIDENFRIAIKSLFALEHCEIFYLFYFDYVKIESEKDLCEWEAFEEFLFSSQRWATNKVTLVSSMKKNGLIDSWNNSARLGWMSSQNPELFFWGSDHDVWNPNFLDFPLQVFRDAPTPQLAIPQCGDLRAGSITRVEPLNTNFGVGQFHGSFPPGYSIYGVFNTGGYPKLPNIFLPDRLFLSIFSLRNRIVSQNSRNVMYLRRRKDGEEFSIERQARNLWAGKIPFPHNLHFPWWCSHLFSLSAMFLRELLIKPDKRLFVWFGIMVIDRIRRSKTLIYSLKFRSNRRASEL